MTLIRKYINPRQWAHGLAKTSIHNGTSAILSVFGTNGAEQLAPNALHGIGLTLTQAVAVFGVSAVIGAVRFINETTADTPPPFDPPSSKP